MGKMKNVDGFYHPKFQERQKAAGDIPGPFDPIIFGAKLPPDVAKRIRSALGPRDRTAWIRQVLVEAAKDLPDPEREH